MITWDKIVKAVAGAAGAVWGLFGGRDTMLTVMLALMAIDYVTGLVIGWIGKSPKTDSGHLSSSVGWAGLAKKAGELLAVIVGVLLGRRRKSPMEMAMEMHMSVEAIHRRQRSIMDKMRAGA